MVRNGVGLHVQALNQDSATLDRHFFQGLWVGELFYTFALAPTKLSFLAFYWRLFQITSIRLPIKIMVVVVSLWSIIRASISCVPR